MITLTRISGSVFVLNADLIERIDATPDTVITLVDGKKYVVAESMAQVTEAVLHLRSTIIAMTGAPLDLDDAATLVRPATHARLAAVAPIRGEH